VCRLSEVEVVAGEGGFEVRPPFGVRWLVTALGWGLIETKMRLR